MEVVWPLKVALENLADRRLHADRDFAGPLLGAPIVAGHFVGHEVQGFGKVGRSIPLAAFVGEHELINRAK